MDSDSYLFTDWFPILLAPSQLEQFPYQAVGLIYAPPGTIPGDELSQETFSYSKLIATGTSLSDQQGNSYGYANLQSSVLSTNQTVTIGANADWYGLKFGATIAFNQAQSTGWSNETTTINTNSTDDSVVFETEAIDSTSYTLSVTGAEPGDAAAYDNQPFWADIIVLMVKAQYAIWDYPACMAQQLIGAYPSYQLVSVRQLYEAAIGGNTITYNVPDGAGGMVPILSLAPQDCANLLSLDPFFEEQWQGAPIDTSPRFRLIGSTQFGTRLFSSTTSPSGIAADAHIQVSIQQILEQEQENQQTYQLQIEYQSEYTLQQTQVSGAGGILNLGVMQFGGGTQRQNTQGSTQTYTYVFSQTTMSLQEVQSSLLVRGTLDDEGGVAAPSGFLQVVAYRDLALGGIAFQDVNARSPPSSRVSSILSQPKLRSFLGSVSRQPVKGSAKKQIAAKATSKRSAKKQIAAKATSKRPAKKVAG